MFLTGEISASHADENGEERILTPDHCGILPNNCLPCLSSSNPPVVEKKRPSSPDTPSSRRKSLSKLSFKWREGPSDMASRECSRYFFAFKLLCMLNYFLFSGFMEVENNDTVLACYWPTFTSQASEHQSNALHV